MKVKGRNARERNRTESKQLIRVDGRIKQIIQSMCSFCLKDKRLFISNQAAGKTHCQRANRSLKSRLIYLAICRFDRSPPIPMLYTYTYHIPSAIRGQRKNKISALDTLFYLLFITFFSVFTFVIASTTGVHVHIQHTNTHQHTSRRHTFKIYVFVIRICKHALLTPYLHTFIHVYIILRISQKELTIIVQPSCVPINNIK